MTREEKKMSVTREKGPVQREPALVFREGSRFSSSPLARVGIQINHTYGIGKTSILIAVVSHLFIGMARIYCVCTTARA